MTRFENKRKKDFLASLKLPRLDDDDNDLTARCKFNFSYFDSSQDAGQNFSDLTRKQLFELLGKLKDFTTKPLEYWLTQRAGAGSLKILAIYGKFPPKSDFVRPKHVPHQVQWGRFRLGSKIRLVGFIIPKELHKMPHQTTSELFDSNTFYVVFFDRDHRFWPTEEE